MCSHEWECVLATHQIFTHHIFVDGHLFFTSLYTVYGTIFATFFFSKYSDRSSARMVYVFPSTVMPSGVSLSFWYSVSCTPPHAEEALLSKTAHALEVEASVLGVRVTAPALRTTTRASPHMRNMRRGVSGVPAVRFVLRAWLDNFVRSAPRSPPRRSTRAPRASGGVKCQEPSAPRPRASRASVLGTGSLRTYGAGPTRCQPAAALAT